MMGILNRIDLAKITVTVAWKSTAPGWLHVHGCEQRAVDFPPIVQVHSLQGILDGLPVELKESWLA